MKILTSVQLTFISLVSLLVLSGCNTPMSKSHLQAMPPTQVTAKAPAPIATASVTGKWVNQRGSVLELREGKDDRLTGLFTTAVATTKSCIGYPAPVTGHKNGNALALSMTLGGCSSPVVIAMAGSVHKNSEGNDEINILALTQMKGQDLWNSRIVTNDVYTRLIGSTESP